MLRNAILQILGGHRPPLHWGIAFLHNTLKLSAAIDLAYSCKLQRWATVPHAAGNTRSCIPLRPSYERDQGNGHDQSQHWEYCRSETHSFFLRRYGVVQCELA